MKKPAVFFWLVLALALCIRFLYLGILPPGGENTFINRLPSVLAGLASICLLMVIVRKHGSEKLGIWSGAVLALMPWHIEQSRVISESMIMLALFLGLYFLTLYVKQTYLKVILFVLPAGLMALYFKSWFVLGQFHPLSYFEMLHNFFKLISYDFLFSANDSFWTGGLRKIGVFLPFTLIPFLIGLYVFLKSFNTKYFIHLILFGIIVLLAVFNPLFPEQSEYLWVTPHLALLTALGLIQLMTYLKNWKNWRAYIAILVFCLITYDYVLFFHYYVSHYSERIKNELPYEKRTF